MRRLDCRIKIRWGTLFLALLLTSGCAQGPETKIQLVTANYGYVLNRKDVMDDLTKICQGQTSCTFNVGNDAFTAHPPVDPAPGDDKRGRSLDADIRTLLVRRPRHPNHGLRPEAPTPSRASVSAASPRQGIP